MKSKKKINEFDVIVKIRYTYEGINVKICKLQTLEEEIIRPISYRNIYKPYIQFNKNEIIFGENEGIHIFERRLLNDMKETTSIIYQNKTYQLKSSDLVAIYISTFIRMIEKNYIIKDIEVEISTPHKNFKKIMNIAFQCLNKTSFKINNKKQKQIKMKEIEKSQVVEILDLYKKYCSCKRTIEQMKEMMKNTNDLSHPQIEQMKINDEYNESLLDTIKSQFTSKEKEKYNLCKLTDVMMFHYISMYFESIEDFLNLEIATKKAQNNMERFTYNPVPISSQTRKLFPNLTNLFLLCPNDDRLIEDKQIIQRIECKFQPYDLWFYQLNWLEKKTHLRAKQMIFDSKRDNWSIGTSVFDKYIFGKDHLAFVIFTRTSVFGAFINAPITEWRREIGSVVKGVHDPSAFLFSFYEDEPKQFFSKNNWDGDHFFLYPKDHQRLFWIGTFEIGIYKYGQKSQLSQTNEGTFNFKGVNQPLDYVDGSHKIIPQRIIVIQFD